MPQLDFLIRNGTVATAADVSRCDVAITDGKIVALGHELGEANRTIDAAGLLVLPGGVEGHCHIEQMGSLGVMTADDFYTGTVAAVFGGTTSTCPLPRSIAASPCARPWTIIWRVPWPRR